MQKQFIGFVTLLGRLLITPIFLIAGYKHIVDFAGTKGYMAAGFSKLGIVLPDWLQTVMLAGAMLCLVVGGLSVLLGWQAKFGALLLVLFLLGVTPVLHAFWLAPAEQQMIQTLMFEKNVAIMGGLLFVMAFGAGPLSMDGAKAERRK